MKKARYFRIAGKKNSGKTSLIVALVDDLLARGFRVATLKHTSHDHEFDRPGSDSQRHSAAGSLASVVVSPGRLVYHAPRPPADTLADLLQQLYDGCDIVLCEGHTDLAPTGKPTPLVECVPPGAEPLFIGDPDLAAVITEDTSGVRLPAFSRSDITKIADWLQKTYHLSPPPPAEDED